MAAPIEHTPKPRRKLGALKLLILAPFLVVALLIGAMFFVAAYIDSIAKASIERGGTYALGVNTTVNSADVKLLSGCFAMSGLTVANPSGFKTPHFLSLNDAGLDVAMDTLRSDTVEIATLDLTGIDLNLEKSVSGANYKTILDNLKRFEGSGAPKQPSSGKGKNFIIRKLAIKDVAVHADILPIGGAATRANVEIDRIDLTDVGAKDGAGVQMAELSAIITKAILKAVADSGGLPAELLGDLQGQLSQLQSLADAGVTMVAAPVEEVLGQAQIVADELKKGAEGVGEEIDKVKEDAQKALDGVGDLLGGGKDKKAPKS